MCALYDDRETTILESQGLLVKDQPYRAVLTSQRIILTGEADHIPRSIGLKEVWRIGQDTDPSGDPKIIISIPSAGGTVHTILLHFPLRTFPNALRLRDLWYSEISKILQQSIPGTSPISPQASRSVPAFCSKCGNRLAGGSAFCDRCGARVPGTSPPPPVSQDYGRGRDIPLDIPVGTIEMPRKVQSVPATRYPGTRQNIPAGVPSRREIWQKKSFFSGSLITKPAILIGVILAVVILVAALFFMATPSGSSGFNLSSIGLNISLPDLGAGASPLSIGGSAQANAETSGSPVNPEDMSTPVVTPAMPALTFAPGDPGAVLATYPSLFNSGDGAGLRALLSENVKSQYSLDTLNKNLATARSKGYSIEKIHVTNQIIEEDSATLDADIFWNTAGSSLTISPRSYLAYELYLVYENNQWKLDSLVLSP